MERYELSLLIETLAYIETTLKRADNRENSLTHGQKHYIIQTALIVLRDLKAEYERQRNGIDASETANQIPF